MQVSTDFKDNIIISSHANPLRTPGTEIFSKTINTT